MNYLFIFEWYLPNWNLYEQIDLGPLGADRLLTSDSTFLVLAFLKWYFLQKNGISPFMFSVQLKKFFTLSSRIISPSFHLSEQQQHMGYPICTQSRKRMANSWHTEARFKVTLIPPLENVTAPACKITCIAFNSVAVQSAFNGIETPAATVSLTTGNIQNNYHFPFPQPSLNTSEESGVWTLRAFTLQIKLLQLLNRFPRPFTDLPGKGHIELNNSSAQ